MIGIFITARLGSTRLAEKHLIEANGKTFIEWLVGRYATEFGKEISDSKVRIFITTSIRSENRRFEEIFQKKDITVFYGSDENIPLRHLQCAEEYGVEHIISIDGDDVLCSTSAARLVLERLKEKNIAQTLGLPLGMNVTGYNVDFLRSSLKDSKFNKLETGWGKIFAKDQIEVINLEGYVRGEKLRMTLDYQEDAEFFKAIISDIGPDILSISDMKLIDSILESRRFKLNESLNQEYWTNFNTQKKIEN